MAEPNEISRGPCDAVQARREGAVGLLRELVRTRSVTGEEGAVAEVVERAFWERGLEVDTWNATPKRWNPTSNRSGSRPPTRTVPT